MVIVTWEGVPKKDYNTVKAAVLTHWGKFKSPHQNTLQGFFPSEEHANACREKLAAICKAYEVR